MPAEAFRAWIQGHGLTLDRAAEALGLSRPTLAYYLSGEQPVPKTVTPATEGYDKRRDLTDYLLSARQLLGTGLPG